MFRLLALIALSLNLTCIHAQALDKIVAVVNNELITQSQLDMTLEQMHKQIAQSNIAPPSEATLRSEALQQLINQSLQLQMAQKAKIEVSNAELNQAINSIAMQNHLTLAELKAKVSSESGLSYTQFEQQLRQQILITKLQQMALGSKLNITPAQVNKAVQAAQNEQQDSTEYDITDILIPLPENSNNAALATANQRASELINQLKAGKSVAELTTVVEEAAPTPSEEKPGFFARFFKEQKTATVEDTKDSSHTEINAQDLGLRKKSDLPEVFANEIPKLRTAKVAGPIRTPNGLHILRLNEMKIPATAVVDRNQIQGQLYQQAMMKELPIWLKEMRKGVYIKIND